MDAVIPFVDGSEKVWFETILKQPLAPYMMSDIKYNYYYNYDTLKYVLRGIDNYMPYVNRIFLLVSNIEQVPEYVDQSKVTVILHSDFIPQKYLPVCQANTIEMFFYNIPGLDEEFVYFNDDMIPISPISYNELFSNGCPCIKFEKNNRPTNAPTYKMVHLSFFEAKTTTEIISGKKIDYKGDVLSPIHAPTPLLKSACMEIANNPRFETLLSFYMSRFRRPRNLCQYFWADLLYFQNKYNPSAIESKYMSTADIDDMNMKELQRQYNYICINDYGSFLYPRSKAKKIIENKLNKILPNQCKYEQDRKDD